MLDLDVVVDATEALAVRSESRVQHFGVMPDKDLAYEDAGHEAVDIVVDIPSLMRW